MESKSPAEPMPGWRGRLSFGGNRKGASGAFQACCTEPTAVDVGDGTGNGGCGLNVSYATMMSAITKRMSVNRLMVE
jgi:hypothetical protein